MGTETTKDTNRPTGCGLPNDDLLEWVKGSKCLCGLYKLNHTTFCRTCYFALPYDLRIELWRTWADGFAQIYTNCIDYLEKETTRFTCPQGKNTSSTKSRSTIRSKENKVNTKETSQQEIPQTSDSQKQPTVIPETTARYSRTPSKYTKYPKKIVPQELLDQLK